MEITSKWLNEQVDRFKNRQNLHELHAKVLERVLRELVLPICPYAIIQARPKSIESFAEKLLRKKKYTHPFKQITDLCGARVITELRSEVEAVCRLITENFEIDEANSLENPSHLKPAEFGYRSVHYVVRFRRGQFKGIPEKLLPLKAEIQVRTLLEHVWSDVSHDRIYKRGHDLPDPLKREAARIAAALESADAAFEQLVTRVNEFRSHFGTYKNQQLAAEERMLLSSLRRHTPNNPQVVLRQAQLAMSNDDWAGAANAIQSFNGKPTPDLQSACGWALCQLYRDRHASREYRNGQALLEKAVKANPKDVMAWIRLAETHLPENRPEALECFSRAFEADPEDPAALSGYIRLKMELERTTSFIPLLRPAIQAAIRRSEGQAAVGIELPWALYRAAGFLLILGREHQFEALNALARAVVLTRAPSALEVALHAAKVLEKLQPERDDIKAFSRFLLLALQARFPEQGFKNELRALATKNAPPIRGSVVIIAGGCDPERPENWPDYGDLLEKGFHEFHGTLISGGTREGVSGLVAQLGKTSRGRLHTIGYLPRSLPTDDSAHMDNRYSELRRTDADGKDGFSAIEPLQNWIDLLASGITPHDVKVLGIGGGKIAAFEYHLAWALGAEVALLRGSGREAERFVNEITSMPQMLVDEEPRLHPLVFELPDDPMTLRALLHHDRVPLPILDEAQVDKLAQQIHEKYLAENHHKHPDPAMQPWTGLRDDLKQENRDQGVYSIEILRRAGFEVRGARKPIKLVTFTDKEVEQMAEMEHGRWNTDRSRKGLRFGPVRNHAAKLTPYLVEWSRLPDDIKSWDRQAVRAWPELLAKADLEIVRKEIQTRRKATSK